jgi:type I restriction enzyme S subunit
MKAELRLKDLGIFKTGLTYSLDNLCEPNEGILVLRSANIRDDKIDLNDCAYVNNKIASNMYIRKGDILICSRNGSANLVGKTAVIEKDMNATWGAFMMLLRTQYNSNYINYLLNATIRKEKGRFATSTINQLTNSMLGGIHVDIFTEKVEQQRIVDYLDEKTSAIDARIKLLEKKKDAYTRLKKAMINRAVTRGLDEHVKLKDSGVEWIRMIPEHWEVTRLKDYAKITLGKMIMSNKPESNKGEYTLEKYLKSRNIGWLEVYSNENDVDEMWFNEYEKQIYKLHNGDIVMNEGGDIGKVSLWHDVGYDCYIQNSVNKITPNKHLDPSFLTYFLYATSMTGYFWSIVSQISIAHLTKEKLSYTPIVRPSFDEQQAIAAYLDEKCAKIDAAIANIDKQIDALKRLKRSLINEVITGQRAV